jgi:hypothetical protein
MFLATRPVWLEAPLGGMDRIYRSHKWAGILAVGLAALHWLVEMSDDILKALIGRQGRVPEEVVTGWLDVLRDLAEDMGEWAIYALLAMLVITLWKKFPYRPWRLLHRAMPVLYLMLAFHAALLAPTGYWARPVGALLAVLLAAGFMARCTPCWAASARPAKAVVRSSQSSIRPLMSPPWCAASAPRGAATARASLPLSALTTRRAHIRSPLPALTRATTRSAFRSRRWATTPAACRSA